MRCSVQRSLGLLRVCNKGGAFNTVHYQLHDAYWVLPSFGQCRHHLRQSFWVYRKLADRSVVQVIYTFSSSVLSVVGGGLITYLAAFVS